MWGKSICITPFLPIQILVILQISYGKPALKGLNSHLNSTSPSSLLTPDIIDLELNLNSSGLASSTYSETLSISLTVLPSSPDGDNDTLTYSSSPSFTSMTSGNDSNSTASSPLEPDYYDDINGNTSVSNPPSEMSGDEVDAELVHFLGSTSLPMEDSSTSSSDDDLMAVAGNLEESVAEMHSLSTGSSLGGADTELEVGDESIIIPASAIIIDSSNLHSPPTRQMLTVNADEMQTDIIMSTSPSSASSSSIPPTLSTPSSSSKA